MKRRSSNSGITLVALVVTIIVLLILAAVSMRLVFGENGIISRAKEASEKTKQAQEDEEAAMSELDRLAGAAVTGKTMDANPANIEGDGSEENPYRIESIEDLVNLSKQVSEGNSFAGKKVVLTTTLDFDSDLSYYDPTNKEIFSDYVGTANQTIKERLTTGAGFKRIGLNSDKPFEGNFDGRKYSLLNLFVNRTTAEDAGTRTAGENTYIDGYVGLFGYTTGNISNVGFSGTILAQYVQLASGGNAGTTYIGPISANEVAGSKLSNITSNVNITVTKTGTTEENQAISVGGIVGRTQNIENANFNGTITTDIQNKYCFEYIGGVAGIMYGSGEPNKNLSNHGNITCKNVSNGSIAGTVGYAMYKASGVSNYGKVNATFKYLLLASLNSVGGAIGTAREDTDNVRNFGEIYVKMDKGFYDASIKSCYQVGGAVGMSDYKMTNLYNVGNITIEDLSNINGYVGGDIGRHSNDYDGSTGNVLNAVNVGNISMKKNISSTTLNCTNVGGVVGSLTPYSYINNETVTNQPLEINNVYNSGTITTEKNNKVKNNQGTIIGGTNGNVQITLRNAFNSGMIAVNGTDTKTNANHGVISGITTSNLTATNCIISDKLTFDTNTLNLTGLPLEANVSKMDLSPSQAAAKLNENKGEGKGWKVEKNVVVMEN